MSESVEVEREKERARVMLEAIFRARYTPDDEAAGKDEILWLQVAHITRWANRLDEGLGKNHQPLSDSYAGKLILHELNLETQKAKVGTRPMVLVWDVAQLRGLAREYGLVELVNQLAAESGLESIFPPALPKPVVSIVCHEDLVINMSASEYQRQAARTLIDAPDFVIPDEEIMLVWNAIGLAGEAGEVAELVKKGVFHRHGIEREKLAKELGDVLWYVAALATKAELDLGEIMAANVAKLKLRYPNGWSSANSVARVDVEVEDES